MGLQPDSQLGETGKEIESCCDSLGGVSVSKLRVIIVDITREITQNKLTVKEVAMLYKVSQRTVLRRMTEDSKTKQS
jgi:hypothetical protein